MRLTIVKPDSIVGIDGVFLNLDTSSLPDNLRVVQWNGTRGHEEWTDRNNTQITNISAYQNFIDMWTAAKAEIDAKNEDPFYNTTPEEKQEFMKGVIKEKESSKDDRKIEHPQIPGAFFKPSTKIDKIIARSSDLANTDPLPTNRGCFDDIGENPVPMTVGQLKKLRNAIIDREEDNYLVRKQHIKNMLLATNPLTYDYSTGWN